MRGAGGPHTAAVRANGAFRPALPLEPAFGGFVVRKHSEQLADSQAFSVRASGGVLGHGAFSLVGIVIAVIKIPQNNNKVKGLGKENFAFSLKLRTLPKRTHPLCAFLKTLPLAYANTMSQDQFNEILARFDEIDAKIDTKIGTVQDQLASLAANQVRIEGKLEQISAVATENSEVLSRVGEVLQSSKAA